ncbi:centromere protein V-like [Centruroides vittatus]|uniref:centromere protein V-like n=1 Tax=Centruroides vittatus TaxID=120091 RepID=UPI00350FD01A
MEERQERGARFGGCHCGSVRFEVRTPDVVKVVICDCSICEKKRLRHFVVEEKHFRLLRGADNLTLYTFNTGRAKHYFCKTCGVESFYRPRSNPEGVGVVYRCLDSETRPSCQKLTFRGIEWENEMKNFDSSNLLS